jgi:hypothetical protein
MMQLSLPIPEIDPRTMQDAARRLQKIVTRQRNSYETRRYREHRAAALKGLGR